MALESEISGDEFLELMEVLEKDTEPEMAAENDTKTENTIKSLFTGSVKQLSIRAFFQKNYTTAKRPNEIASNESEETKRAKPFTFPPPKPKATTNSKANTIAQPPPPQQNHRPVPSFKWIPGSGFVVDAFGYGVIAGASAYFLTHFHSDHYRGLTGKLALSLPEGTFIYCTSVTANLVQIQLRVKADRLIRLPIGGEMRVIDEEWAVVAVDANHCPGSAMLIFWNRQRDIWHLHCGDFRYHSGMLAGISFTFEGREFRASELLFDHVFLDTTYARPDYAFPGQDEVLAACSAGCQRVIESSGRAKLMPLRWLICVGSYLIGKERIVLALAEFFDIKIYADVRKRAILEELEWPELSARLTSDPKATPLHIVSMALLSKTKLADYRNQFGSKFTHVLGIRPTGWSFKSTAKEGTKNDSEEEQTSMEPPKEALNVNKSGGSAHIWAIPYSEHSSYAELGAFLRAVRALKVVPTVDNWKGQVHDFSRCNYNSDLLLQMISKR